MQNITISTTYALKWAIKNHENYMVTPDGMVINIKRGKIFKRVLNGRSKGYWLGGDFYSLTELRGILYIPKISICPF